MKALIISKAGAAGMATNQLDLFRLYRRTLASRLGFRFRAITVASVAEIDIALANKYDAVFIQNKIDLDRTEHFIQALRSITAKKILLDDSDSTGTVQFKIVDYVDVYVKKQALRDPALYARKYAASRFIADMIMRFADPDMPPVPPRKIPPSFSDKLFVGWNLGCARGLIDMSRGSSGIPSSEERSIDIALRARTTSEYHEVSGWYHAHREGALDAVRSCASRYRVVATDEKILPEGYFAELRDAKICVSPWGYGEVCYRDFEAILSGALLVKPSMDHVVTHPDIYVPFKTYVPVKPDWSDLAEKCAYYLDHPDESAAIIRGAQDAYAAYFDDDTFVAQIKDILEKIGFAEDDFAKKEGLFSRLRHLFNR